MIAKTGNQGNRNDIDRTLVGFYENEILPQLTAEMIFTHPAHKFHKDLKKWRGGCPWHKSESGSSFAVDRDSLMWWCAGCSKGGSAIDYVHRLTGNSTKARGVDFVEAIRKLAEMTGRELPKQEYSPDQLEHFRRLESRRSILQTVIKHCQGYIPEPVRAYLHSRGFPDAAISELGLGYYKNTSKVRAALKKAGHDLIEATNSGLLTDALEGYIIFPWCDERGRPLTIYGSWQSKIPPEGKPKKLALWNPKDKDGNAWESTKRSPLYYDRALQAGHKQIVLVEGVTDGALLQFLGDSRVVACVAAQLSKRQVETLKRDRMESIIICLDPDQAGENGILSNIRSLCEAGIEPFVAPKLPDGLDPDDFVLKHGIDAWREHIFRCEHGFRHQARTICEKHTSKGLTDFAIASACREAKAFYNEFRGEKLRADLDRYFVPEIQKRLGVAFGSPPTRETATVADDTDPEPTIRIITAGEILETDYGPDKPVIDGVLGEKESLCIVGASGLSKSLITIHMALAIASPKQKSTLWGKFNIPEPVSSLFIQSENSLKATQRRLHDIVVCNPEMRASCDRLFFPIVNRDCRVTGDLCDSEFQVKLIEILEATGAGLLVIDPLISYHYKEENSNSDMRKTLDRLTYVCDCVGCAVVVVHHAGWDSTRSRGATAIVDWAANIWMLEEVPRAHGQKSYLQVKHQKARNFERQPPFHLDKSRYPELLLADPQEIAGTVEVLSVLAEAGGVVESVNELLNRLMVKLSCSERTARRAHDKAIASGMVRQEKRGRKTVCILVGGADVCQIPTYAMTCQGGVSP